MLAIAMSLISGLRRWTAMSRLRSSANATASSSVRRTTGRVSAAAAATGCCAPASPVDARSAASLISSLSRASDICPACAGFATPISARTVIAVARVEMCRFRVIANSLHVRGRSTRLLVLGVTLRPPVILVPLFVQLVQLHPLLGAEHLPHAQQHQRACLVEVGADALDLVDLPRHHRLVGVRRDQARELRLLLVQLHLLLTEESDCGLKDAFNSRRLLGGEAQILLELRVVPPREAKRLSVNRGSQHYQEHRRQ